MKFFSDKTKEVYYITKDNVKWWMDHGYIYLHHYNVAELIFMVFLMYMFFQEATWMKENYKEMTEWQMAALAQFPLAIWAMATSVWKSINTDLPPKPSDAQRAAHSRPVSE